MFESGGRHVTDTADLSLRERGRWLVDHRQEIEQGESRWLGALARFDDEQGWAADGQTSCIAWLEWKLGMGRSTAYEKKHLAHSLDERRLVADAFHAGRISYSAARLLCRLEGMAHDTEEALVRLAETGTIKQLEQAAEAYRQMADQERPPADPHAERSVRLRPLGNGSTEVKIIMPDLEALVLYGGIDAFKAKLRETARQAAKGAEPARADDGERSGAAEAAGTAGGEGGGVSACAEDDGRQRRADEADQAADAALDEEVQSAAERPVTGSAIDSWRVNQALAFAEMVRCAIAHVDDGEARADDLYMVHVVARDGQLTTLDGTPIDPTTAGEILCDAAIVAHTTDEAGEPLSLGRKTREWSTAQRRAVLVRDGGRCRFVGCQRRVRDIHHRQPWEAGGSTDVANGMAVCRAHHTLLHHGFSVHGEPGGALRFERPDGSTIGTTHPVHARLNMAA
jgi:hypothetical protein